MWLVEYFSGLLRNNTNVAQDVPQEKKVVSQEQSKVDEDIKKGALKEIQDDDSEFIIGISKKSTIKQKGGKVKVNKNVLKAQSSTLLTLDISVIKQIKDIGLKPPTFKSEISNFIDSLCKKYNEYEKTKYDVVEKINATPTEKPTEIKPEVKPEVKIETKPQVEAKVEETKKEEKWRKEGGKEGDEKGDKGKKKGSGANEGAWYY